MKPIAHLWFICCVMTGLFAQAGILDVTVQGNTATLSHTQTYRNCGSLFDMDIAIDENHITWTQIDTGASANCNCYFDLSVTIGPLDPGTYFVDVYSNDMYTGTSYLGSDTFAVEGITLLGQDNSGCLGGREDSAYVSLTTTGDTLILFWHHPELNCCLEEVWSGWLGSDTLHVTMIDTGAPCDCLCPFDLTANFGPFAPGTYVLDFEDGVYGYPPFTIPGASRDSGLILGHYQSDCYQLKTEEHGYQPDQFSLLPNYPNPFNPVTTISYEIPFASTVNITIYDLLGEEVAVLINELQPAGSYSVKWNAGSVPSGIYFYRLKTTTRQITRKMAVLK